MYKSVHFWDIAAWINTNVKKQILWQSLRSQSDPWREKRVIMKPLRTKSTGLFPQGRTFGFYSLSVTYSLSCTPIRCSKKCEAARKAELDDTTQPARRAIMSQTSTHCKNFGEAISMLWLDALSAIT